MINRGLLIVISGPSGVGKDTILGRFMPKAKNCVFSVSATTRQPRKGEVNGRDYFFVTRDKFEEMAQNGEMLEFTEYNGNYYGTPRKSVEKLLEAGENVILEIEVDGGLQIKKLDMDAVLIFIVAPSWAELERRLRSRATESEEAIQARLATARFELSKACEYDYIITNDILELCAERLAAVIVAAGCEAKRMNRFIEEVSQDA